MSEASSVLALIKLLADDHAEVVEAARAKLVEIGQPAVVSLHAAAELDEDAKVRVEARNILELIRLQDLGQEWHGLVGDDESADVDLESAAFLMSRVYDPSIKSDQYREQLDGLAEKVATKIKRVRKPKQQLLRLNEVLFEEEGFNGNWNDYFDPENSYLSCVLSKKLGIPISLSVVYLLVAHRVNIDIGGVGVPGHFMVKYQDDQEELYVDVFNQGRFLSRPECIQFIVESGYPYQREFLDILPSRDIVGRMLRNLILIYLDRKEETLGRTLIHFLDKLYPDFDAFSELQGPDEKNLS